jgi:hypothetical protein
MVWGLFLVVPSQNCGAMATPLLLEECWPYDQVISCKTYSMQKNLKNVTLLPKASLHFIEKRYPKHPIYYFMK